MIFSETILITGVRANGRKVYAPDIPACVVDDGVPSDAIDNHLVASCDQFTFFIRAADWPAVYPPQIGDIVRRNSDETRKFAVTRVARLGECISLNCRSK